MKKIWVILCTLTISCLASADMSSNFALLLQCGSKIKSAEIDKKDNNDFSVLYALPCSALVNEEYSTDYHISVQIALDDSKIEESQKTEIRKALSQLQSLTQAVETYIGGNPVRNLENLELQTQVARKELEECKNSDTVAQGRIVYSSSSIFSGDDPCEYLNAKIRSFEFQLERLK